ncbi:hypothetical protein A2U01_0058769 [Trifolium medium]|uniref:Uncharacterized protein n=1 Tax=Trifolium medium TaxID=97028 RepID=A0A392RPQ9_9FABA|nr:hypothetical protein [Trifolium medium]
MVQTTTLSSMNEFDPSSFRGWVLPCILETKSVYASSKSLKGAYLKVGKVGSSGDWEVVHVHPSTRICSPLVICGIPMYEIVFSVHACYSPLLRFRSDQ